MKRTLIAILAAMFVASAASAGTMTIDLDKNVYTVGEQITVTATGTLAGGGDVVQNLGAVGIQIQWNSAVATTTNTPGGIGFGTSSQIVTVGPNTGLAALAGPSANFIANANTNCANAGTCSVINQTYTGTAGFNASDQTVVGTLVLTANAAGLLGNIVSAVSIINGFAVDTNTASVVLGANWAGASVVPVPEPTTAALLGLGLLGLGFAGRRR